MLRVAVFLECGLQSGGGFQYELTIARLLQKHDGIKYKFIFFAKDAETRAYLESIGLQTTLYSETLLQKIHRVVTRSLLLYPVLKRFGMHFSSIDRLLDTTCVDLVYFLSPNPKCPDLSHHNFIITVWDLCHRDFMEFPEVNYFKEFENRELLYTRYLKKAVTVITESETGKKNIIRRYGVDSERVQVLPFLPPQSIIHDVNKIDIKIKYGIDGDYLFYPAQFWAHKNHIYILDALRILKQEYGLVVHAIFSGADQGILPYIMASVKELELSEQVRFAGFVDADEIPSLYKQALALVMPTYFGPTNLPPLEAFYLECPVCYSDLKGLREQVQDAAFLMDLNDPRSLVDHLLTIKSRTGLVLEKIEKGKTLVSNWQENDFWRELESIFDRFAIKRRCWTSGSRV